MRQLRADKPSCIDVTRLQADEPSRINRLQTLVGTKKRLFGLVVSDDCKVFGKILALGKEYLLSQ